MASNTQQIFIFLKKQMYNIFQSNETQKLAVKKSCKNPKPLKNFVEMLRNLFRIIGLSKYSESIEITFMNLVIYGNFEFFVIYKKGCQQIKIINYLLCIYALYIYEGCVKVDENII